MKAKRATGGSKATTPRIGEIHVCSSCLRSTFERSESASGRCRCGGRIIAMPRSEVDARRRERG